MYIVYDCKWGGSQCYISFVRQQLLAGDGAFLQRRNSKRNLGLLPHFPELARSIRFFHVVICSHCS